MKLVFKLFLSYRQTYLSPQLLEGVLFTSIDSSDVKRQSVY